MTRRVHPEELRERQRMRADNPETPPFELLALADGQELYRTEYRDTRDDILEAADEANEMLANGKEFEHEGKTVDEFVPGQRLHPIISGSLIA